MFTLLILSLFFAATLAFGCVVAAVFLPSSERRWYVVVPTSLIIGLNGYVMILNLVAYLIPVQRAFWVVLTGMSLAAAAGLMAMRRRKTSLIAPDDLKPRERPFLVFTTFVVMLLAGFVSYLTLGDDLYLVNMPLASTISEGNFPVLDPSDPSFRVAYHYGPDLLIAALHRTARMPLWLGYDIQTFLFIGAAFLMAFALARSVVLRFRSAFLAALLMLYGSGLVWMKGFHGIAVFWQKLSGGSAGPAPWKFFADMAFPNFDSSIAATTSHTVIMGMPIILLVLYLYNQAIDAERGAWLRPTLLAGVLYGYTAFVVETHFIVMFAAFIGMLFLEGARYLWSGRPAARRHQLLRLAGVTGIVIVVALPLAFLQGGILTTVSDPGATHRFELVKHFWSQGITDKQVLPFRWAFFQDFGLPLILFFPALYFFRNDRRVQLIALIAFGAFLVPLLIRYTPSPREMERFFGFATQLFAFLAGLFLSEVAAALTLNRQRKMISLALLLPIFAIVGTALAAQAFGIAYPLVRPGGRHYMLAAVPPEAPAIDQKAYVWIREHTTLQDWFFPYSQDFIREVGRFTPGPYFPGVTRPSVITDYQEAVRSCRGESFAKLGVTYLYVSPRFPITDFKIRCLPNLHATSLYQDGVGPEMRSVYRLE